MGVLDRIKEGEGPASSQRIQPGGSPKGFRGCWRLDLLVAETQRTLLKLDLNKAVPLALLSIELHLGHVRGFQTNK